MLYWRLKINNLLSGKKPFDSIEMLELEIDDNSDLGKLLKGDDKAQITSYTKTIPLVIQLDIGKLPD